MTALDKYSASFESRVPSGTLMMWAGTSATVPNGWLLCNGATINRTTYSRLFSAISTRYGAGDGSTTFVLPNLTNNIPVGLAANTSPGATTVSTSSKDIDHTHNTTVNWGTGGSSTKGSSGMLANNPHDHTISALVQVYFIIKT